MLKAKQRDRTAGFALRINLGQTTGSPSGLRAPRIGRRPLDWVGAMEAEDSGVWWVWLVMPWTVTLGGRPPLVLSFLRGFYYGWKRNEWANFFRFRGSAKYCPPRRHWVLLLCVEELGERVRAGGKWETGTLFLQVVGWEPREAHTGWQVWASPSRTGMQSRDWLRRQPG